MDIKLDCSDTKQYQFFFVSTVDDGLVFGTLSLVEDVGDCDCNDLRLSIDPCLFGAWNLDLSTLQPLLQAALSNEGFLLSSTNVGGDGILVMSSDNIAEISSTDLSIHFQSSLEEISMTEVIQLDGTSTAQLAQQNGQRGNFVGLMVRENDPWTLQQRYMES
jgi:hypothetical protein